MSVGLAVWRTSNQDPGFELLKIRIREWALPSEGWMAMTS